MVRRAAESGILSLAAQRKVADHLNFLFVSSRKRK